MRRDPAARRADRRARPRPRAGVPVVLAVPWLTVEQNVALAVEAVHKDKSRAERAALVRQKVELVGLGHAADRKPAQLSGGMRQRVAVARALAMEPEILLLDEPLSALDALTRARLQGEIERIRAEERRTIILVTNDVDEALLLADRVAVLTPRRRRGSGASSRSTSPVRATARRSTRTCITRRCARRSSRISQRSMPRPGPSAKARSTCQTSRRSTSRHPRRPIATRRRARWRRAISSSSGSTRSTRRPTAR
jgi:ABC-type sulfate/molybdate transport systems ATPase subunit